MYLEAACASAQSEVLELNEAGLLFSSERTDSVFKALSHWTSLFEKCLEHFLFILKVGFYCHLLQECSSNPLSDLSCITEYVVWWHNNNTVYACITSLT